MRALSDLEGPLRPRESLSPRHLERPLSGIEGPLGHRRGPVKTSDLERVVSDLKRALQ